jgi:1-acyl-sn-glycerol-3-phosphate acyltransferase
LRSARRSGAWDPVWALGRCVVYPLSRLVRWTATGLDRIPSDGSVVLASNHISFLDPMAILWLGDRRRRKVRFMAKAELWKSRFCRFFLVRTGQIRVSRHSAAAGGSLGAAEKSLAAGECVCIYPEGTISPDLEPMAAKNGIGRLAVDSRAPILPVGVWGTHRLFTAGRKPRPRIGVAVSIVVGEPVAIGPTDDIADVADRIMAAICDCVAEARRIYPQRPRGRDDGWWVRGPETAVPQRAARHHRAS